MDKKEQPTIEAIQEIAEELRGTCGTLDKALEERGIDFNNVPVALLDALDAIVMCCDWCGWWVESEEINEDCKCRECAEDE